MSNEKYYWVYLPEVDEAGTVVQAKSFTDAANQAAQLIDIEHGQEVQVHELGESLSFTYEEVTNA